MRNRLEALCGLLLLFGFAWTGEALHRRGLGLPGAVIGLVLLAVVLGLTGRTRLAMLRRLLAPACGGLIRYMGVLFVPAGVGVLTELDLIRREWAPLLAGVAGSTLVTLAVTGWLMHRLGAGSAQAGP